MEGEEEEEEKKEKKKRRGKGEEVGYVAAGEGPVPTCTP